MKNAKFKKPIIILLAVLMTVAAGFSVWGFLPKASASGTVYDTKGNANTISITSPADLIRYSEAYYAGTQFYFGLDGNGDPILEYCCEYDNIIITNTVDFMNLMESVTVESGYAAGTYTFKGIGTETNPFRGSINFAATSNNFFIGDQPFFNCIGTEATFIGEEETTPFNIVRASPAGSGTTDSTAPLFANTVKAKSAGGDANQSWYITDGDYEIDEDYNSVTSYGGLIGMIDTGAQVSLKYKHESGATTISTSNNAGFIAGTIKSNATLDLTMQSGGTSDMGVTSTGGHAGGLVGEMENGSTLTIETANYSGVTSVTASASGKYAGGIVGYANVGATGGVTVVPSDYNVGSVTVTGAKGAGGLFGYYRNNNRTSAADFSLAKYTVSGVTVDATGSTSGVGGIFGELYNNGYSGGTGRAFNFNGSAKTVTVSTDGGKFRGGIIGKYWTNHLNNTLDITNVTTVVENSSQSGGLIGSLPRRGETAAAYVSIHGVTCGGDPKTAESNNFGKNNITFYAGLIADEGGNGSFIDITGNVTITQGMIYGGLIGEMQEGVLRLNGVTDLSDSNVEIYRDRGVIVRDRGRSLIYALGDGATTGWQIKRRSVTDADDIYTWGQVIRGVDGTNNNESGSKYNENALFTITDHTVQIKAVDTNSNGTIDSVTEFALTALNIQLNTATAVGALQFTSGSANESATLLGGTLTLSQNINLTGTGFTGFTRDGYHAFIVNKANVDNYANECTPFTGTFDGGDKTITLDTGAPFGVADYQGKGGIHNHPYTGLFAVAENATIQDVTVSGTIEIHVLGYIYELQDEAKVTTRYVSSLVAYARKELTFDNVTISGMTITVDGGQSSNTTCIGGAAGCVADGATILFDGGSYSPAVSLSGNAGTGIIYSGGLIGKVESGSALNITIGATAVSDGSDSLTTIGGSFTKNGANTSKSYFGGVIGAIDNATYAQGNRKVKLQKVKINGYTATAPAYNSVDRFGGVLGTHWLSVDVDMVDFDITSASVTTNLAGQGAVNFGGLVQTATGHWDVKKIALSTYTFTIQNSSSTFGFVANTGYATGPETALYIDVDYANYGIGAFSLAGTLAANGYDEILAKSIASGNIEDNGQAIVSVTTTKYDSKQIIDTSKSTHNTYVNKTAYSSYTHINRNTRYYYNLAYARTQTATPNYKFFVWSVKQYAHSSISSWFTTADSTFTGDLDMTGLSYYPVTPKEDVTFASTTTIILDNDLMQPSVNVTYDSTATRTTRSKTNQHYLMHAGVFLKSTANISMTGVTMQGNVPRISDTLCGFFIMGTLGGSNTTTRLSASNITFDGVYITNGGAKLTSSFANNAPLFINNVGKNTNITIAVAVQSGYSTLVNTENKYAATSLIGDVGSDTATGIYLTFSGLKFDARTTASTPDMDTAYGTARTIFINATLLRSFQYDDLCSGSYDFNITDDHNGSEFIHKVTYGKEITSSSEYSGRQKKYYDTQEGSPQYYVHPTTYQMTADGDYFSSGYLPYVKEWNNAGDTYHELRVNVKASMTINGCGKYGHPYQINDGKQLGYISRLISGTAVAGVTLYLPYKMDSLAHTTDDLTHADFTYVSSSATYSNSYLLTKSGRPGSTGSHTISDVFIHEYETGKYDIYELATVREYLAGAYYQINTTIELESNGDYQFTSLGTTATEDDAKYAFRGVISGPNDSTVDITNNNNLPLIKSSNGCVVRNVTIKYKTGTSVSFSKGNANDNTCTYKTGGLATFGAVIAQVMGGDTIIDNVDVDFTNLSMTFSGTYQRMIPVGGYIGTVVNGGVIFRNMAGKKGLTTAKTANVGADSGYLYVNPIIGRVVAGYAFYEVSGSGNDYKYTEETVTLKNTDKNYSIPDLKSDAANLLSFSAASSPITITVPDGQAMYVLAAIVNSGAGAADGASAAYNALTLYWQAYRNYCTARSTAQYNALGTEDADYALAASDTYGADASKTPYIMAKYVASSNRTSARCITYSNTYKINVVLTGNIYLGSGYRGIGSIYYDSNNVRVTLKSLKSYDGQNYTVNMDIKYLEYTCANNTFYKLNAVYARGFGLFNCIREVNSTQLQNFKIAGTVTADLLNYTSGNAITYVAGNTGENGMGIYTSTADGFSVSTGGVIGVVTASMTFTNADFNGLSVKGPRWAGGLIGYLRNDNKTETVVINQCDTVGNSTLSVSAGHQAGGLIGKVWAVTVQIGDGTWTTINIGSITVHGTISSAINVNNYESDNNGLHTAGGLIGYHRPNATTVSLIIRNVTLKGGRIGYNETAMTTGNAGNAGGFIGHAFRGYYTITDCKLDGVDIYGEVVGGVIGGTGDDLLGHTTITNFEMAGDDSTLFGRRQVGGLIGSYGIKKDDSASKMSKIITISGLRISGYTIKSDKNVNYSVAGGLIGDLKCIDVNSKLVLNDIAIEGCNISSAYSGTTGTGTGGLFGIVRGSVFPISGYDFMLSDTIVRNSNSTRVGTVVGVNVDNIVIKITGLSFDRIYSDNEKETLFYTENSALYSGTGSYVVFADYNGVTTNTDVNGEAGSYPVVDASGTYKKVAANGSPTLTVRNTYYTDYTSGDMQRYGLTDFYVVNDVNGFYVVDDESGTITVNGIKYRLFSSPDDDGLRRYNIVADGSTENADGDYIRCSAAEARYVVRTEYFKAWDTGTRYKMLSGQVASGNYHPTSSVSGLIDVPERYPYATVNPSVTIGGVELTGDGVANAIESLALFDIIGDSKFYRYVTAADVAAGISANDCYVVYQINSGKLTNRNAANTADMTASDEYDVTYNGAYYRYIKDGETGIGTSDRYDIRTATAAGVSAAAGMLTSLNAARDGALNYNASGVVLITISKYSHVSAYDLAVVVKNIGKFELFTDENENYGGTNFPVLIVDNTNAAKTHELINSYLRILTNTTFDFGNQEESSGNIFTVSIYRMAYTGASGSETFSVNSGASLMRNVVTKKFYMTNTTVDSGKGQFSLIDVCFKNPENVNEIVYHLYVPVFVKKVLSFDFDVELKSGTTYYSPDYTDDFGNYSDVSLLLENIGTPVTYYFSYTYNRTAEEWLEAIYNGESVNRNYDKYVRFVSDLGTSFKTGDRIVLIDANDGGKTYYATLATAFSSAGIISLQNFDDGADVDPVAFSPVKLNDMFIVIAGQDNDGRFTDLNADRSGSLNAETADVVATDGENKYYLRLRTDEDTDGNVSAEHRFSVTGVILKVKVLQNAAGVLTDLDTDGSTPLTVSSANVVGTNGGKFFRLLTNSVTDKAIAASHRFSVDGVMYADSVTQSASGIYTDRADNGTDPLTASTAPLVVYNGSGRSYLRLLNDADTSISDSYKYSVTFSGGGIRQSESYYLTLYTNTDVLKDNSNMYNYYLTAPKDFSDPLYPSRVGNARIARIYTGKIFVQENFNIASPTNKLMAISNNVLTVNTGVTIKINGALLPSQQNAILQSLLPITNVYQSFVIYMTKDDGVHSQKIIACDSQSGNYVLVYADKNSGTLVREDDESKTVTYNGQGYRSATGEELADESVMKYSVASETNYTVSNIRKEQNYIEFVTSDISEQLSAGSVTVVSTITMTYNSEDAITLQFAQSNGEDDGKGTIVSGKSNIAYSPSNTATTGNTSGEKQVEIAADTPKLFYSAKERDKANLYLVPYGDDMGDFTPLGINVYNYEGDVEPTSAQFDLSAMLDLTDIIDTIGSYNKAVVTITLSQKQPDGTGYTVVNIQDYLTSIVTGMVSGDSVNFEYAAVISDSGGFVDISEASGVATVTVGVNGYRPCTASDILAGYRRYNIVCQLTFNEQNNIYEQIGTNVYVAYNAASREAKTYKRVVVEETEETSNVYVDVAETEEEDVATITIGGVGYRTCTSADVSAGYHRYSIAISNAVNPKTYSISGPEVIIPLLHFVVKTGAALESDDLYYSNYCITVTVVLYNDSEVVTDAANFVIYTNAKIIPDYIG